MIHNIIRSEEKREGKYVPRALDFLPEKGNESGDRPHCVLRLILPTEVDNRSSRGAAASELEVKTAACCPKVVLDR